MAPFHPIDYLAYPHVFDLILDSCSRPALLRLRGASRTLRHRIDLHWATHLAVSATNVGVEDSGELLIRSVDLAKLPAFASWLGTFIEPVPRQCALSPFDTLTPLLKHTTALDIHGLVPCQFIDKLRGALPNLRTVRYIPSTGTLGPGSQFFPDRVHKTVVLMRGRTHGLVNIRDVARGSHTVVVHIQDPKRCSWPRNLSHGPPPRTLRRVVVVLSSPSHDLSSLTYLAFDLAALFGEEFKVFHRRPERIQVDIVRLEDDQPSASASEQKLLFMEFVRMAIVQTYDISMEEAHTWVDPQLCIMNLSEYRETVEAEEFVLEMGGGVARSTVTLGVCPA